VRTAPVVLALALAACEPADDKCWSIYRADMIDGWRRDGRHIEDTVLRKMPPPKPSEYEWYDEHCWKGQAR
jgi:hypothetical protein